MKEQIVLLHGLGRDSRVMQAMADFLRVQGVAHIYNHSYPSLNFDFPILVQILKDNLIAQLSDNCDTHFIAHSMGGLLVRLLLTDWRPKHLGALIQISSPNQGTPLVNFFNKFPGFKRYYGPAAIRMSTAIDPNSIVHTLTVPDYRIGLIASNQSAWKNKCFDKFILKEANDGIVTVAGCQFKGMQDFIVVPATHLGVASDPNTLKQSLYFLRQGCFQ